ncbi:MAG: insulinase family protein [Archangium sp.]|nr:insulinase family protein [Archangium sp.]
MIDTDRAHGLPLPRLAVLVLFAACATPQATQTVATKREPGLESMPNRSTTIRQLPPALDIDPATKVPTAPLEFAIRQPEIVKLKNGIQVYLLPDRTTPLLLIRALLPNGSADDPVDKVGLNAIMTVLLAEGGAGTRTPEQLDELIESRAADLSAGAGDENAVVTLSLRSEDLALLLPAFADVVQRPRFDEKRFTVVTGRVFEAIRRREDTPADVASRAVTKAVFGPQSVLGRESTEATVKAITVGDLKKLHEKTWGSKDARLIVSGDFDRATLIPLLEKEFGAWKGGVAPIRKWDAPTPLTPRLIVVPRKIAQAKVRIGTYGYQRRSEKEYPLRLLATSLGAFGVGRLYKEIRDERGLAYSANASVSPGPTSGMFVASFDTKPDQVGEALEVALRILKDSATTAPLTAQELRTAQDMATNAFAFRFEGAAKIALERATFDLLGYPADYLPQWRAKIGEVKESDAKTAAAALTGLQIVIVGPPDKLGDLSRFGSVVTINDVEQFK